MKLPFPSSGDLSDPGIKPESPALAGGFVTTEPPGKPGLFYIHKFWFADLVGLAFCYGHRWALAPDDVAGTLPCALSSHINTAAANILGHAPSRSQERISLGSHPRVELLGDSYLQHFIWLSQTLIFTRFIVLKRQLIVKFCFFCKSKCLLLFAALGLSCSAWDLSSLQHIWSLVAASGLFFLLRHGKLLAACGIY